MVHKIRDNVVIGILGIMRRNRAVWHAVAVVLSLGKNLQREPCARICVVRCEQKASSGQEHLPLVTHFPMSQTMEEKDQTALKRVEYAEQIVK